MITIRTFIMCYSSNHPANSRARNISYTSSCVIAHPLHQDKPDRLPRIGAETVEIGDSIKLISCHEIYPYRMPRRGTFLLAS